MKNRLIVEAICDYISKEIERGPRTLRFVLPSYSSGLLLEVGKVLKDRTDRILDRHVKLEYRVAYHLGQDWLSTGSNQEQADFLAIRERGFYDSDNSLTKIRNMLPDAGLDCLVIVMAGFDHITDQGSLQDFYKLDQKSLWESILHKSFISWVSKSLENYTDPDEDRVDLEGIDIFLNELYQNGLTDLVGVSEYLGSRNFSEVVDIREAFKFILNELDFFNLPRMGSLFKKSGRISVGQYIVAAQSFLNYSKFINTSDRQTAIRKIEAFREEKINNVPEEILGDYQQPEDMIADLLLYVESRNEVALKRLTKADFPFIYDKILKHKLGGNSVQEKPTKLMGVAPEVFLRAVWITLGDFINQESLKGTIEEPFQISIISTQFKHDFAIDEDDDDFYAKEFLRHILGGIDEYIEERLKIPLVEDSSFESIIQCNLVPGENNNRLNFPPAKTAEPSLAFEVSILKNQIITINKKFVWVIPHFHSNRVLNDLFGFTLRSFSSGQVKNEEILFALTIPYMSELYQAKDEEEANRLLIYGLRDKNAQVVSFATKNMSLSIEEKKAISDLFYKYQTFLDDYDKKGFFGAINGDSFDGVRKAYQGICDLYLKNSSTSQIGQFLMKAFMVASKQEAEHENWKWNKYLSAAIVTPLHPAMLEMLLHQYVFLFNSFSYYVKNAMDNPREKALTTRAWNQITDLAKIQRPIFATLKNDDAVLDTNIKGTGYIHMLGSCKETPTSTVSRFLLEYDSDEEEEVTDSDLFKETRESILIRRLLCDYLDLHTHANDGISIGAFCGQDIQPIIAGIDKFMEIVVGKNKDRTYSLSLTIFTDSNDDSTVMKWVNAWKERWQVAELTAKKQYYNQCIISISYIVTLGIEGKFEDQINSRSYDVFLLSNFINSGSSRFVELGEDSISIGDYQKFPILDKMCCRQSGGGTELQRDRILSYGQFRLACLHAEVLERLKNGHQSIKRHLVVGKSDYSNWEPIIRSAHQVSVWVICIDPVIDEYLIRNGLAGKREIIGFGTGVGSHGESNYTISTEQFTIDDVKKKIGTQTLALFNLWDNNTALMIAESIIREASYIGGLSLVRATGPIDSYIHDYFAYSIIRKILPRDTSAFCDEIISLDAFRHWFYDADDTLRPDLIRVKAYIRNGYFDIDVHIIECKLANYSEGYLTKARQQIESGLNQLVNCFKPREARKPLGITLNGKRERPDQRYWWMQLHRLITSKGSTEHTNYTNALQAMERLSEGQYNIQWKAAAVAIWTDYNAQFQSIPEWQYVFQEQEMKIAVVTAGGDFVHKVCLENYKTDVFESSPALLFGFINGKWQSGSERINETNQESGDSGSVNPKEEVKVIEDNNQDQSSIAENKSVGTKDPRPDESLISVISQLPERILLGSNTGGGRDIYWEFGHPDLPNRHILIFGASGTGKTYAIQGLLSELGKLGQNSLIIDYTNGFTPNQLEGVIVRQLNPKQHIVRKEPVPINPFRQQSDFIDDLEIEEAPTNVAQRVMGVFSEVYNLGDQQRSALYNAIRTGAEIEGSSFNLQSLLERLRDAQDEGGPIASSAASVISKIQPFVDLNPFGREDKESWEKIFSDPSSRCHIIQLATFAKDASRLITEFCLFDLYRYYRGRGSKNNPKIVVLDEIQNLDHSLNSPLGQFLTEGRKFGISLILATQTLSNLEKDEKDRLFQASHKLFFKPADTEVKSFAQILESATGTKTEEWVERLSSLKRGECYSLGFVKNDVNGRFEVKCNKIKIRQLEERF